MLLLILIYYDYLCRSSIVIVHASNHVIGLGPYPTPGSAVSEVLKTLPPLASSYYLFQRSRREKGLRVYE